MNVEYSITGPGQPTPPQQPAQLSMDEIVRRVQCGNIQANTRLLEAQVFLNGLGEIRTALNWPTVSDGDTGLNERPPIQPMFGEIDTGRLQERYFKVLDLFMGYLTAQAHVLTPTKE